jgi:hypothetical protein
MTEPAGAESLRTYEEINARIKRGDAVVVTANEFIAHVAESGLEASAEEVDVVTTGTFGAMCSSGAFLNFGHSEPPIKMSRCWLNDVPAYKGLAAVDAYIGATAMSESRGFEYGGGRVIEDLVSGKEIVLHGEAYGTDCYPRRSIETTLTLGDLNQAILVNPRNAYQHYSAALSDASATAICNAVTGTDLEASVQAGLEAAEGMPHLRGALVVRGRYVGSVGRLPRLLNLKGEVDDMFRASLYDIGTQDVVLL